MWLRAWTVAKHLQRAGYCNGRCSGEPLVIRDAGACVIVQWDANSNGRWEPSGHSESEQTGFRLQKGRWKRYVAQPRARDAVGKKPPIRLR